MYFNFCFCFFTLYSYRNYEFTGLKICTITAGTKKYKSIFKKKKRKKNNDKIVFLTKSKLYDIEVLISKALLIDSNIGHDEFILINNVLKEYDNMKEEIKNLQN